jgi:C-terminal processing protease CtpA/Prc
VASAYGVSDAALARALAGDDSVSRSGVAAALRTYASQLGDVCSLPADYEGLGRARVEMVGQVAIVTPGTGDVALPPRAQVAVLDLRELPAVDGLDAALARAAAPALHTPVAQLARWRRTHNGPIDEWFSPSNVYSTSLDLEEAPALPATGPRDIPLVLLTGPQLAPAAARFAEALRVAGRAHVLGADVFSEVAESDWRGVGRTGLAVRTAAVDHVFRPAPPTVLRGLPIAQDVPTDPTTASYKRDFVVAPGTRLVDLRIDGGPSDDLDLYVLYDANGDGRFDFPQELAAVSAGPTSHERVRLFGSPPPGRYQLWVHGYSVPGSQGGRFDLTTDVASGQLVPDVIAADRPLTGGTRAEIARNAAQLAAQGIPPVGGPVGRTIPAPVDPFGKAQPVVTGKGEMRAALVIAHGMARLFFPYFDVVGDGIDARLAETLSSVAQWDGIDRLAAFRLLRRFGEVLHDGHQYVFNLGPRLYAGWLPVFLEEVNGRPVVRRSAIADLRAGDTILAMNGRPIKDIYAEERQRTSAATPGYQFDIASRYISRLQGPVTLMLADPEGETRSVTVAPQPVATYLAATDPIVSDRPSGPLTDLGAPDQYYLNLNSFTTGSTEAAVAAIADAVRRGARGLVLDMRGYPGGIDHYEVAARLIRRPFTSAQFHVLQRMGPDVAFDNPSQISLTPLGPPAWDGPIALLTGPHAVSAAENFMQMLVGAHRPSFVVGQRSAGTNGNITAVQLPGGFAFSYTGMQLLNPDGSRFHGIGILPDIEVPVTPADLHNGVDRDLLTAADLLRCRGRGGDAGCDQRMAARTGTAQ